MPACAFLSTTKEQQMLNDFNDPSSDSWIFRNFGRISTVMIVIGLLAAVIQIGAIVFIAAKTVDAVSEECTGKDAASCAGGIAGKFKKAFNEEAN